MKRTLICLILSAGLILPALSHAQVPVRVMDRIATNATETIDAVDENATLNLSGRAGVSIQVTGTFTGTLEFQVSNDNTNFVTINCAPPDSTTAVTSTTSTGMWFCDSAAEYFRVRSTAWTSGSASVTLDGVVTSASGAGGAGIDPVRIHDGTDVALVTAAGDLNVECSNCSGSGATHTDDAAFTAGTDDLAPSGMLFDDTTPDSVDEDDLGVPRMSANRNAYTTIRDAAGNERGVNVDASNRLTAVADLGATDNAVLDDIANGIPLDANTGVDIGDVDVTSVVPGTGATNLGKLEDAAHNSGDTGVLIFGVHQSTQADFGQDGDNVPLSINDIGEIRVAATLQDGGTTDIGNVDVSSMPADATELPAVSTLGDNLTPPSSPFVYSLLYCWDATGGNADRCVSGDQTEDAAHTTGDTGPMTLTVRDASPPVATSNATNDYEPLHTDDFGALWTVGSLCGGPEVQWVAIDTAAQNETELVALAANQSIIVCGYNFIAAGTTNVALVEGTGTTCQTGQTTITGQYNLVAQAGIAIPNGGAPQFIGTAGEALCLDNSAAVAVDGLVSYVQKDLTP